MADLSGQDIGRYHIIEQLGQGGMATVYKAYDTRLERDVAVKVIRMEQIASVQQEHMLKRFEREGKSLAKMMHPNIVPIYDYGDYAGSPYLVMGYIPGGTLKTFTGSPMPYPQAARLLAPVARALAYAHGMNVIHRDVKPANILVTSAGEPMLSDFGIAKILESEEGNTLTGTGVGVGTPEYMAPEQWLNEVVPQTDIYSLGVVFYELVTGRKPYTADTPAAVLIKQTNDPLPRPRIYVPGLPDRVEQIIFKALAKKPGDRYPDMTAFAAALENLAYQKGGAPQVAPAEAPRAPANTEKTRDEVSQRPTVIQPARKKEGGSDWKMVGLIAGIVVVGLALLAGLAGLKIKGVLDQSTQASSPVTQATASVLTLPSPAAHAATATREVATALPSPTPGPEITATAEPKPEPSTTSQPPNPTAALPQSTMGTVKNKTKISPGDGAVMMYVPEGNFLMGSSDGQIQAAAQICSKFNLQDCEHRYLAEKPLHAVYLDAYWIDRTDVTNARYAKCVNAGACTAPHNKTHLTKAFFTEAYYDNRQFADFPVIYVDWNQADQYCQWAGRRLPTEAEWEKAARGTDGRSYPWGEGISCQKANYAQKKDKDNSWCFAGTTNVFYFAQSASPYGVLDMAGNVAQWVADWADESYYLNSPERNPGGPSSGQYRVMRGGSWLRAAPDVRSATRGWNTPDLNEDNLGFRCAVSAAPSN